MVSPSNARRFLLHCINCIRIGCRANYLSIIDSDGAIVQRQTGVNKMRVKTVVTGVGSRIVELIKAGELDNKEILEVVRKENPMRRTSYACVAWYQSKLKKEASEVEGELKMLEAQKEVQEKEAAVWAEREAALLMEFEKEQPKKSKK